MDKAIILAVLLCIYSVGQARAAPPILGPDCGVGATIVGSKNAGKVIIGSAPVVPGYFVSCTLNFVWPKTPSCTAMLEGSTLDPAVDPGAYATVTSINSAVISNARSSAPPMDEGYVIAYLCVGQ